MEEVCLEMDSSCGSLHQTHSKAPAFRLSFFFFLEAFVVPESNYSSIVLYNNRFLCIIMRKYHRTKVRQAVECWICKEQIHRFLHLSFLLVLASMLMFALSMDRCQGANCVSLSSKVKPWAQSVDKRTAWNGHPKIRKLDLCWQTVSPQTVRLRFSAMQKPDLKCTSCLIVWKWVYIFTGFLYLYS